MSVALFILSTDAKYTGENTPLFYLKISHYHIFIIFLFQHCIFLWLTWPFSLHFYLILYFCCFVLGLGFLLLSWVLYVCLYFVPLCFGRDRPPNTAQASLKLATILLPRALKCWDCRCVPTDATTLGYFLSPLKVVILLTAISSVLILKF